MFLLALLVFGVWGAIKITFWVLVIAVVVAAVVAFLGRGLFGGPRSTV